MIVHIKQYLIQFVLFKNIQKYLNFEKYKKYKIYKNINIKI